MKGVGLTDRLRLKLYILSVTEESGISSVVVKYVDIRKNASGESGSLGYN